MGMHKLLPGGVLAVIGFVGFIAIAASPYKDFWSMNQGSAAGFVYMGLMGLSVGCKTEIADFKKVWTNSKLPFAVACFCQFLLMPLVCFCFTHIFEQDIIDERKTANIMDMPVPGMPPPYDVVTLSAPGLVAGPFLGIMLTAALPGGVTSNWLTLITGGNVELSVSLSFFSNVLCMGTIPALLHIFWETRFPDSEVTPLAYKEAFLPIMATIWTIGIGMMLHETCSEKFNTGLAAFASFGSIVGIIIAYEYMFREFEELGLFEGGWIFWFIVLSFQPLGYFFGYGTAFIARQEQKDRIAIAFETGVQNFGLGATCALIVYGNYMEDAMAKFTEVYTIYSTNLVMAHLRGMGMEMEDLPYPPTMINMNFAQPLPDTMAPMFCPGSTAPCQSAPMSWPSLLGMSPLMVPVPGATNPDGTPLTIQLQTAHDMTTMAPVMMPDGSGMAYFPPGDAALTGKLAVPAEVPAMMPYEGADAPVAVLGLAQMYGAQFVDVGRWSAIAAVGWAFHSLAAVIVFNFIKWRNGGFAKAEEESKPAVVAMEEGVAQEA